MKNIITATIEFSFKGKRHSPSLTIELDPHLKTSGKVPNLYPLIARENGFDLYSYEYEMMQAEPIFISDAKGLVAEFISNNQLDNTAFEDAWNNQHILEKLSDIIIKHMRINPVDTRPEFKQALLAAYKLGKEENTGS